MATTGPQDAFLISNPDITYFKIFYRRHTNFSTETMEQFFNNTVNFGKKAQCDISRNADLCSQIIFKIVVPEVKFCGDFTRFGHVEFAWVRRLGFSIIEDIQIEIGGSIIDTQYGHWMNIWYEMNHLVGQEYGHAKMIGDVPELTSISTLSWDCPENEFLKPAYVMYIPLQFYFCQNNGLAIPLIALQYHYVKFYARLRNADQCYIASEAFKCNAPSLDIHEASLYVNYIFLDKVERKKFAQSAHEYLITQIQFSGEESIGYSNTLKAKLNFCHPVKSLYFVTILGNYQGRRFMVYEDHDWEKARYNAAKLLLLSQYDLDEFGYFNDVCIEEGGEEYIGECGLTYTAINPASPKEEPRYCFNDTVTAERFLDGRCKIGLLSCGQPLLKRPRDIDLRDKVEGVIRIYTDYDNNEAVYPEVERITRNDLTITDLSVPIDKYEFDNRCPYIRDFDLIVWQHNNYGLLIDGTINPITKVLLQINSQDRQTVRIGMWYDTVEPYMHFPNSPCDGLNVFPFGLEPTIHQPTGSCNFSRVDNCQLNLWFSEFSDHGYCDVFSDSDNKVYIYAMNYNILRIIGGMGGLAFAA